MTRCTGGVGALAPTAALLKNEASRIAQIVPTGRRRGARDRVCEHLRGLCTGYGAHAAQNEAGHAVDPGFPARLGIGADPLAPAPSKAHVSALSKPGDMRGGCL